MNYKQFKHYLSGAGSQRNTMKNSTSITKTRQHRRFLNFVMMLFIVGLTVENFAAPLGVYYDYFGTGRSDYLVINEENGQWRWDILSNPIIAPQQTRRTFWGLSDIDYLLYGDYDGDGKHDIGVWRPGDAQNPQSYLYIQRSTNPNPNAIYGVPWGLPDDLPLEGDFDGDGKFDAAIAREEGGNISRYILPSGGGEVRRIVFGLTSDFSIMYGANINGDGRDDIMVTRVENNGQFTIFAADGVTGNLIFAEQWGTVAGYEVVLSGFGDYLGDSRADLVHVFGKCGGCPNEGTWWIKETGGSNVRVVKFGVPISATSLDDYPFLDSDFDGDGKLDIEVFRGSNSTFYSLNSSDGQLRTQHWDGNSTSSSGLFGLIETTPKPQGKSIPVGALKAAITVKQPDGTYKTQRASEFYLKK